MWPHWLTRYTRKARNFIDWLDLAAARNLDPYAQLAGVRRPNVAVARLSQELNCNVLKIVSLFILTRSIPRPFWVSGRFPREASQDFINRIIHSWPETRKSPFPKAS